MPGDDPVIEASGGPDARPGLPGQDADQAPATDQQEPDEDQSVAAGQGSAPAGSREALTRETLALFWSAGRPVPRAAGAELGRARPHRAQRPVRRALGDLAAADPDPGGHGLVDLGVAAGCPVRGVPAHRLGHRLAHRAVHHLDLRGEGDAPALRAGLRPPHPAEHRLPRRPVLGLAGLPGQQADGCPGDVLGHDRLAGDPGDHDRGRRRGDHRVHPAVVRAVPAGDVAAVRGLRGPLRAQHGASERRRGAVLHPDDRVPRGRDDQHQRSQGRRRRDLRARRRRPGSPGTGRPTRCR